jgi:hypothetical protein
VAIRTPWRLPRNPALLEPTGSQPAALVAEQGVSNQCPNVRKPALGAVPLQTASGPGGRRDWLRRSAEEFSLDFEVGAKLDDGGALRIGRFGEVAQFELVGFSEGPRVASHDSDERLPLLRQERDGDCPAVGLRLDCV